jgi:hypothetical protein
MTDTGTVPDYSQGTVSIGTQHQVKTADVEIQTFYTGTIVSFYSLSIQSFFISGGVLQFALIFIVFLSFVDSFWRASQISLTPSINYPKAH